MRSVAGCLALFLCGCGAVRQEVALNFQVDPSMPTRVGKIDITVNMVR